MELPLSVRMPESVRARISASVAAAVLEANRSAEAHRGGSAGQLSSLARTWRSPLRVVRERALPIFVGAFGTAAATVLIFMLWQVQFSGNSSTRLAVLQSSGSASTLLKAGGTLEASRTPGAPVHLHQPGLLVFSLPAGGSLALEGPGEFQVQGTARGLSVTVHFGRVFVHRAHAQGPEPAELVWQTRDAVYRMAGTTAQLAVTGNGDTLQVLEGSFRAGPTRSATKELYQVGRGQELAIAAGGTTVGPHALSPVEAEQLERTAAAHDRLARGEKPIDPYRHFENESQLRAFYGRIDRIELQDGRAYRGFAARNPKWTEIHTVRGVVLIPNASIRPPLGPPRAAESP